VAEHPAVLARVGLVHGAAAGRERRYGSMTPSSPGRRAAGVGRVQRGVSRIARIARFAERIERQKHPAPPNSDDQTTM
jgi:ArsR family transcriptional regulator, cadmium/lead-responsive transcriptional repressor